LSLCPNYHRGPRRTSPFSAGSREIQSPGQHPCFLTRTSRNQRG
jgi:hypothetical protein